MSCIFLDALANTNLYPLTDRHLSALPHAEQVSRLSEAGATVVQLREKILSPHEFYRESAAAVEVARERGVKIIINDRVDIALALKADGVHLGQDDLPPAIARSILGPEAMIGFSTHNPEQARLASKMPLDYVAIGPIFATSTKQTSYPALGLIGVNLVRQVVGNIPLVAIGGITSENCHDVLASGADAVAVIGEIWRKPAQAGEQIKHLLGCR